MACEGQIVCTVQCTPTPATIANGTCPYVTGNKGASSVQHAFDTATTITVMDISIDLFKTARTFLFGGNASSEYVECGPSKTSGAAEISEQCNYTESTILYLNLAEKFCLYTRKNVALSFAGHGSQFVAVDVGGFPAFYLLVPMGSSVYTLISEVHSIRDGVDTVLYTNSSTTTGANENTFFLYPTPDPSSAGGVVLDPRFNPALGGKATVYNRYASCIDAGPEDLPTLDGGRDMYFPEWLRAFVKDPLIADNRTSRYNDCRGDKLYGPKVTQEYPYAVAKMPCGSFARHPKQGEFYNFFVKADDGAILNIKSKRLADGTLQDVDMQLIKAVNEYLPDAVLGSHTVYYPISLI